ncbi:uncharacterized protein HGUI_03722 [Hanseniaspora guilliermondii]|uniref:Eukaryotic translation initiation factor 4E n=1 Tax=Hanseniaspora guilliermondii TaxID=56406 RepID=A0A1L0CSE4_9ASCO|nr:uncharacterized protein HGUI_03722 [Hanseniaspora guilliermondii]
MSTNPLQYTWSFFFNLPPNLNDPQESWEDQLVKVCDITTLEQFWGLQNSIPNVKDIKTEYMFFKENIQPKWEDPQNEKGGRFVIHLNDINIENFWNRLLFSILGNDKFLVDNELSGLINGFYISYKKKLFKAQVWIKDCTNTEKIHQLGEFLLQLLNKSNGSIEDEVNGKVVEVVKEVSSDELEERPYKIYFFSQDRKNPDCVNLSFKL